MIVYGKNPVKEAIYANRKISKVYLDEKFNDNKILLALKKNNLVIQYVSKGDLSRLTENGVHQGIAIETTPYKYYELEDYLGKSENEHYLILDGINDPQNLGAIMRSAEAVRLDGIIMSKKQQVPLNATVAKTSCGAIEHVKVFLVGNLNNTIQKLQATGVLVIGTDASAIRDYTEIAGINKIAIVVGNEGFGIRPLVKRNCDFLVKIPMYGVINSLNVSVSTALLLYQTIKKEN